MSKFACNVGTTERVARFVVGAFVTSLWFWGPETPWALIGLVPMTTGALGFCPLYTVFGFSTCKRPEGT